MISDFRITLHVSLRKNEQEEKRIGQELVEHYLFPLKSANRWMPKHKTFCTETEEVGSPCDEVLDIPLIYTLCTSCHILFQSVLIYINQHKELVVKKISWLLVPIFVWTQ